VIAPEALSAWDGTSSELSVLLNWSGVGTGCFVKKKAASPFVNANEFGFTQGIDNAIPINKAINSEESVIVPAGNIVGEIVVTKPTVLTFIGELTKTDTGVNSRFIYVTSSDVEINNAKFSSANNSNLMGGIFVQGSDASKIRNIRVKSSEFSNLGRFAIYYLNVEDSSVVDIHSYNCNRNVGDNAVLSVQKCDNIIVDTVLTKDWRLGKAIAVSESNDCMVSKSIGITAFTAAQSGLYCTLSKNIHFDNYIIDVTVHQPAMKISSGSENCVAENGYINNLSNNSNAAAVMFQGSKDCEVRNSALHAARIPLRMVAGDALAPVGAVRNIARGCDIRLIDTASFIFQITSTTGREADGNKLIDCRLYDNNNQATRGLDINGNNTEVSGCEILVGAGNGISFASGGGWNGLFVNRTRVRSSTTGFSCGGNGARVFDCQIESVTGVGMTTVSATTNTEVRNSILTGATFSITPASQHLTELRVFYCDLSRGAQFNPNFYRRFCVGMADNL
jgi:hypothetical protein